MDSTCLLLLTLPPTLSSAHAAAAVVVVVVVVVELVTGNLDKSCFLVSLFSLDMNRDPFNTIAGQSSSHSHAPDVPSTNNSSMSASSPSSATRPPPAPSIPPLYLPPPGKSLLPTCTVMPQTFDSSFCSIFSCDLHSQHLT